MATVEVQHPVPTAVLDGSCFQEEEHGKVPIQDGVPATTKVEAEAAAAAPGVEQVQVPVNSGVSEEQTKGQEEDHNKENPKKDHHKDVAAVATDDAGDGGECQVQAVAQEVKAKLGLGTVVQDGDVVDSAAPETDEAKLPKDEEAERRREVTRKAATVVVPVDDDDGLIDDGEPVAPQKAASEAPQEEKNCEGEGEELKEEKAHEE